MSAKKHQEYELAPGPDVDLTRDVVRDRRGRRITNEYVERLVDATHEQPGRGRPSLTAQGGRSPQVAFRLPPELRDQAETLAAHQGKRVSDIARAALVEYLKANKVS